MFQGPRCFRQVVGATHRLFSLINSVGHDEGGANMRLVGGFHCFVWGCLAASLYAGAANPNRDVNYLDVGTALADPDDLSATRASPDVRPALAEPEVNVRSLAASDTCLADEDCIDQYLWSIYERTRKLDTIKVQELMRVTVKKKGHTRTVMKGITKLADEDFTWKDPQAAQRAGMSLVDYVIGGMDHDFKARNLGSGDPISIEIHRTLRRSTARNMPITAG